MQLNSICDEFSMELLLNAPHTYVTTYTNISVYVRAYTRE